MKLEALTEPTVIYKQGNISKGKSEVSIEVIPSTLGVIWKAGVRTHLGSVMTTMQLLAQDGFGVWTHFALGIMSCVEGSIVLG